MKIYIASSYKNEEQCRDVAFILRQMGHEVDCFCDDSCGRKIFGRKALPDDVDELDAIEFMNLKVARRIFITDKRGILWSEAVLLILPAGRSAHLEAGFARGKGKRLFVLGGYAKGEWDAMYGFAERMFRDIDDVVKYLKAEQA